MSTIDTSYAQPRKPQAQQSAVAGRSKTLACTYCRSKKVRCNNTQPCQNCIEHGVECIYIGRRRRKKRESNRSLAALEKKIAYYEGLLRQGQLQETSEQATRGFSRSEGGHQRQDIATNAPENAHPEALTNTAVSCAHASRSIPSTGSATGHVWSEATAVDMSAVEELSEQCNQHREDAASLAGFSDTKAGDGDASSILSQTISGLEYHGPRASMSLCSKAGVDWVKARSQSPDFQESALLFTQEVARSLKIEKPLSPYRKPEPSEQDAWKFARAYFSEAHDAALGIVHQGWFEARLQAHFARSDKDTNVAWYALRNIIYASGCRIESSKSMSFVEAQQRSWPWFENAISTQLQLTYWHTTIVGVQALTVMAYFTEAISSPILQYMTCSTAVRVGVAKGIHRRVSSSWDVAPGEESLRSCIFWALFCLEKQMAARGDRSSCIDDDEISCPLPTAGPAGSTVNLGYFTAMIRLCQLSSIVSKKLSSVSSLRLPAVQLINNVNGMSERLERLKQTITSDVDIQLPMNLAELPSGFNNHEALTIQFLYYTVLWQIHSPLFYPWSRAALLDSKQATKVKAYLSCSASIVAESSKRAILESRYIQLDASCSLLVGHYAQLYAASNIFISILQDPSSASAPSQASLMTIASGYFARVDIDTVSCIIRPFVTDMTQIAHNAIRAAKNDSSLSARIVDSQIPDTVRSPTADSSSLSDANLTNPQPWEESVGEWLDFDLDYDFEMWSTMTAPAPDTDMLSSLM